MGFYSLAHLLRSTPPTQDGCSLMLPLAPWLGGMAATMGLARSDVQLNTGAEDYTLHVWERAYHGHRLPSHLSKWRRNKLAQTHHGHCITTRHVYHDLLPLIFNPVEALLEHRAKSAKEQQATLIRGKNHL
ncbi:hypothetical protein VNO77_19429 [Canavalia gladiata]|uniref:Uncharacterized protein n=1 Tax=Canavalia gladiata TaxID=3824 RepID=A0AAN9LRI5_CANGL